MNPKRLLIDANAACRSSSVTSTFAEVFALSGAKSPSNAVLPDRRLRMIAEASKGMTICMPVMPVYVLVSADMFSHKAIASA